MENSDNNCPALKEIKKEKIEEILDDNEDNGANGNDLTQTMDNLDINLEDIDVGDSVLLGDTSKYTEPKVIQESGMTKMQVLQARLTDISERVSLLARDMQKVTENLATAKNTIVNFEKNRKPIMMGGGDKNSQANTKEEMDGGFNESTQTDFPSAREDLIIDRVGDSLDDDN